MSRLTRGRRVKALDTQEIDALADRINSLRDQLFFGSLDPEKRAVVAELVSHWRTCLAERLFEKSKRVTGQNPSRRSSSRSTPEYPPSKTRGSGLSLCEKECS